MIIYLLFLFIVLQGLTDSDTISTNRKRKEVATEATDADDADSDDVDHPDDAKKVPEETDGDTISTNRKRKEVATTEATDADDADADDVDHPDDEDPDDDVDTDDDVDPNEVADPDDDTDREKSTKGKKAKNKKNESTILASNFSVNEKFLTSLGDAVVDSFKILNEKNVVDVSRIKLCFKNADLKQIAASRNANEAYLQVVEEYLFCYINVDLLKESSLLAHWNEIINQLYHQCNDFEEPCDVALKIFRRWGHLVLERLIESVWKPYLKVNKPVTTFPPKVSKKMAKDRQEILNTRQSFAFLNIVDLSKPVLTNKSFFSEMRIVSIIRAFYINNGNKFKQNRYRDEVENIDGSLEQQVKCDAEYTAIISKRESNETKKIEAKILKSNIDIKQISKTVDTINSKNSTTDNINSQNSTTDDNLSKQTTMKTFYKSYKDKVNDKSLMDTYDLDDLLDILAKLLIGGLDGFKSSILQSDQSLSVVL